MAAIRTEYCVEIYVPLRDGNRKFGSGYTLGPHWVLTAHHVLFGEGVVDEAMPITLVWWDESEAKRKDEPREVERDQIVWFDEGQDIALIRCDAPYSDMPLAWDVIGRERPSPQAECESVGFLSNLKDSVGKQRRKNPTGSLARFSRHAQTASFTSQSENLSDEKLWAGFSGSPLFADGKLSAVVSEVNTHERDSFNVSFVCAVLDKKGGRDQIPLRNVPGFLQSPADILSWRRLRPGVVEELSENPMAFARLRDDFLRRVAPGSNVNSANELAQALYETPKSDVIRCFHRVLHVMINEKEQEGVGVIEYLAYVWLALVAATRGDIRDIEAFKRDPSAKPLTVKAVAPVLVDVEAQVADGEERRPMLVRRGQRLRSPLDFTPRHNTGLDEGAGQAVKDTASALHSKTQPGRRAFSDVKDELRGFVTRPETGIESLASMSEEDQGALIGYHLEVIGDELLGSVYIRVPEAKGGEEHTALGDLHRWCPQLLLIEVSPGKDPERVAWMSTLHKIILDAQQSVDSSQSPTDGKS